MTLSTLLVEMTKASSKAGERKREKGKESEWPAEGKKGRENSDMQMESFPREKQAVMEELNHGKEEKESV